MDTPTIRIGIIDDQNLFRKALFEIIKKTMKNIKVVLEAENGEDFIEKYEYLEEPLDICLLDIHMPMMDGYETIQYIKRELPNTKVLALSMYENAFSVSRIMQSGANGFISKNSSPSELKKAILNVHYTGQYKAEGYAYGENIEEQYLTDKEIEFLKLCCTDLAYADIAKMMRISLETLNAYKDAMFKKLNVKTRIGLVYYILQKGIVL